ncbi:replication initiation protein, partial [Haemophilus influenzae]|uniref:replication initiation protein n=1 Tax=Haemophilus influenzae TaxID=727 RepID=UPI000D01ADC1
MANDLTVVKANSLIEASYRLTLDEMRLLALTIGTMNPKSDQQVFEFSVSEFVNQFPEVNADRAYTQIKSAIERISERWVKTEDERHVTKFRWVSSQTYFKKEGRFKIALTNEIMPYLTQLKGQFTQYQLNHISGFSSVHAIRLYELFTQYKRLGERYISVEELKKWLQLEDKYDRYNNLNQRVLTPALSEINEKSDLFVEYEPIKKGRKVTGIEFRITHEKPVKKRPAFPHKNKYG